MAFTTIQGTVTRTMFNGKGAEVTETFQKRDGSEGKTRLACWFEAEHGLAEGDTIEVSGLHGDQVDDWTDREGGTRHSVKRSINKARIKAHGGSTGSPAPQQQSQEEPWAGNAPTPQAGAGDVWNQPGEYDSGTPF
jgi:hypothetical protein